MKLISSDGPFCSGSRCFSFYTPPAHPILKKKKKNVLVKAISAKRGFLVKCGGNQLNAELKGRRDSGQICRLLKSRTPSPPPDLAPGFNYPHPTVSLLTLCNFSSFSSVDLALSHLTTSTPLLFRLSAKCSKRWQSSF